MAEDPQTLRQKTDQALEAGKHADAVCYLAELAATEPENRTTRVALAIALGDAGYPVGALKILRATADRLAHKGFLLPAMVVIKQGLKHAPEDPSLNSTLKRIHVRGVRAKAGNLPVPPPLKNRRDAPSAASAEALLALDGNERMEAATRLGTEFPPAGEAAIPLPMPLFSELDDEAFVETVKRLRYRRVAPNTALITEGEIGDTLLVVASGHVRIERNGQTLARLGPGTVIGEMALITGAPRSATVIADEEVEVFELARGDVESLAKAKPVVAEELVEYCRKRLIGNLLQTSPLFKRFDESTRYLLIDSFQRRVYQGGQSLITQGQPGEGLFVLAAGEVDVSVEKDGESVSVATLKPGDVVGEISLLHNRPTTATVKAKGRVGALFLPRDDFQEVLDDHPDVRDYLVSLGDDRVKASEQATDVQELEADDLIIL
ncbi:MAG: cyclic nucleotide-binding domain-containing protein [Myxococcota bacterium]